MSSQPMVKPLTVIREGAGGQARRQGSYDADGFLVDDDDEVCFCMSSV